MIILSTEYSDVLRARGIPGAYWNQVAKSWTLDDPTPRSAVAALRLFPALQFEYPQLLALRDSLAQDVRPADYAQRWWDAGGSTVPLGAPVVTQAMAADGKPWWDFQRKDIGYLTRVLQKHGGAYLGWERGLGKTAAAMAIAESLGARRVLIVTPNTSKYTVWQPQWAQYGPQPGVFGAEVLPNVKGKREALLERMHAGRNEPQVLVAHYEALNLIAKSRARRRGWDRFGKWDLIIADEAHHLSNPNALWSRSLKIIPTEAKLAMSGSIIQNRADELYSPLQWLFPTQYSSQWRDWNDRFLDFVDIGHREYIGVKIEQLPALRDELGRFMTYRRGEDELDLPPITTQDIPVTLSPHQRHVYDELERDSIVALETGEVIKASYAVVLLTRLRQIATGLGLVSGELDDSAKIDTAIEIIKSNPDEPFVVFSWFVGAAESFADRLRAAGVQTLTVTGAVPHERRAEYVRRFQSGEAQVFIGTIGTLGESHTLDRAAQVIFLDRSWNPSLNDQSVDRVAGGFRRKRHVHVTNLIAEHTVDETKVTPRLSDKRALRAMILGASKGNYS